MSRQLTPLKNEILSVIVVLESALEFVEDDLPAAQTEGVRNSLADIALGTTLVAGVAALVLYLEGGGAQGGHALRRQPGRGESRSTTPQGR